MFHFINKEQRYKELKDICCVFLPRVSIFVTCKLTTGQSSFILLGINVLQKQHSANYEPKLICSVFHLRYLNMTLKWE